MIYHNKNISYFWTHDFRGQINGGKKSDYAFFKAKGMASAMVLTK